MADYIEGIVEQDPQIVSELLGVTLPEVISVNGKTGVIILKVSDLENDSGFVTNTVNNLANYYLKTETYTKTEVNNLIGNKIEFVIAETLPETGEANKIYLIPSASSQTGNTKDEYIWLNNSWERIGGATVDLSNYYTKAQTDAKFVEKVDGKGLSKNDYSDEEKSKVASNTTARHTHSNKELLDTYSQTEENLSDAVSKKHTHSNRQLLDTYDQTNSDIEDAVDKKHSHTNKSELDLIQSGDKAKWDDKYDKPQNGIPKTDMASDVQTSLGKADTALQEHQSLNAYRTSADQDIIDSGKVPTSRKVNGHALTEDITVTKGDVGLGNVDNTSDANKPISTATQSALDVITGKIPSEASSSNKLADKDFVNSSIATETAHYISNNGEPFTSLAQLEAYTGTVTNNDYAFVTGIDAQGNTYYDRYKASVSGSTVTWAKEYRLNNSSFTAAQWAAISSGITSVLVASYNAHIADTDIHVTTTNKNTWNAKYDKPQGGIPDSDLAEDHYTETEADALLLGKVDKVEGKQLSTEDYTSAEKTKLSGIEAGAEVNVNADWNATSGDAQILNKPTIPVVPTTLSSFTDDLGSSPVHTHSQYLTEHQSLSAYRTSAAQDVIDADKVSYQDIVSVTGTATNKAISQKKFTDDMDTKANASDLTSHTGNTSNPHSVTKAQVGLSNVPNIDFSEYGLSVVSGKLCMTFNR